ncbi:MAG TPA: hypothetical protein VFM06_12240 [Candidatus Limnocylindria bacterium]|nr:hypothetical protein [Candidatus Limnocylindria bacterium]
MSGPIDLADLDPEERELHHLLASVAPVAPPVGFRDRILDRVRSERRVVWEWIVAALLALPSLVFLARQALIHGEDFALAMANIVTAASTETNDAFFFVDGLTVLAIALLGLASAFAAHALVITGTRASVAR